MHYWHYKQKSITFFFSFSKGVLKTQSVLLLQPLPALKRNQNQKTKQNKTQKPATVKPLPPQNFQRQGKGVVFPVPVRPRTLQERPLAGIPSRPRRVAAPPKARGPEKGSGGDYNFSFSLRLSSNILMAVPPIDLKSSWERGTWVIFRAQPSRIQTRQRRVKVDLESGLPSTWSPRFNTQPTGRK